MPRGDRPGTRGGLRLRLTLLSSALLALIGILLLALAYLLVGRVVAALPQLPPGTQVQIGSRVADAGQVAAEVVAQGRQTVLVVGLVAFPLQLAAGALLSWVLIGRALRPLTALTRAARQISESSLDQRIAIDGPRDEVADLADSFDEMVGRLQHAFAAERRFVANASHELKTPLAVIRTEVDVTMADRTADIAEYRRMAEVVISQTERADALLRSLLLLARTQARGVAVHRPVDLAALVEPALQAISSEVAERRLRVETTLEPGVVSGDPSLLERLIGNLVENAVRHNVSDGWITVLTGTVTGTVTGSMTGPRAGAATVTVASSGPVVDPATVTQLFEPFRQGIRARTSRGGTGLGLSIVQAVVDAHGGMVSAEPVTGGGLRVSVSLPTGPDAARPG